MVRGKQVLGRMLVAACAMAITGGITGCSLLTPPLSDAQDATARQAIDDSLLVRSGTLTVALDTRSGAGGALRPQVLLDAAFSEMGRPAPDAPRVRRLRQGHEESGRIVEPFGPFDTEARAPLS